MKTIVAEHIKELMSSEKRTQTEFATAIGVGQSSVSDWLNSKSEPSVENLWKICDYFDISIDYLVGRKEI